MNIQKLNNLSTNIDNEVDDIRDSAISDVKKEVNTPEFKEFIDTKYSVLNTISLDNDLKSYLNVNDDELSSQITIVGAMKALNSDYISPKTTVWKDWLTFKEKSNSSENINNLMIATGKEFDRVKKEKLDIDQKKKFAVDVKKIAKLMNDSIID